jgi:hypothetical protein
MERNAGVAAHPEMNRPPHAPVAPFTEDDAGHPFDPLSPPAGKKRKRTALVLGLGSTLLSVLGFGALTLFEQYNGMVSELRSDLKHFNETSSEYVKRDSFQRFRDQTKERFKELQESNLAKYRLEMELKASEKSREELTVEVRRLRERIAFLEGRQTAASGSTGQHE